MDRTTSDGLTKGAKEVKIHDVNETLRNIAREGDLQALYEAIKRDPEILDTIDKIPFVQTPLHEAAGYLPLDEARRTQFALELMILKPSLGRKLNPDGDSPLHLAVRKGFSDLAKRLIKYDSDLIRVKGREGKTPLHLVAETGDSETEANLLAEFLFACPESIKDLTTRDETAFHVAVKHHQFKAFQLIFEWMWRSYNGDLLIWKDQDGSTVLHIAVYTNQLDIVKYLMRRAPIIKIEKNSKEKTAFDIAPDESIIKSVLSGHVKLKPIPDAIGRKTDTTSLREFLLPREPCFEKILRFILYCRRELSLDMRNMVLVVAVLIATATYQDMGTMSDYGSAAAKKHLGTVTDLKSPSANTAGLANLGNLAYLFFNTISFTASIAVMISVLSLKPFTSFLHLSLLFLAMSYDYKMVQVSGIGSPAPILLIILLVYAFKMMYFRSMDREIKMEMPAIWMNFHPRWRNLTPVPIPLARLRMVYQLMKG